MIFFGDCICVSVIFENTKNAIYYDVLTLFLLFSASVPLPNRRNDSLESDNQQRLLKTLETITNRLKRTLRKAPLYSFQFSSEMIIADSNSLEEGRAVLFCRPGSVLKGRMCGKGTCAFLLCPICWLKFHSPPCVLFLFFSFIVFYYTLQQSTKYI